MSDGDDDDNFDEGDDDTGIVFDGKCVFACTETMESCKYFTYDRRVLTCLPEKIDEKYTVLPPEDTSGYTYSDAVRYCFVNKLPKSDAMQVLRESNSTYYEAMQSCQFVETRTYRQEVRPDGSIFYDRADVYNVLRAAPPVQWQMKASRNVRRRSTRIGL